MHRLKSLSTVALAGTAALLALSGCHPEGVRPPQSGKDLYAICESCHGEDGQGMKMVDAPAIAGLPAWYVEAQLTKFRTGIRGAHPDDYEGLRMRPMSRQLMNEDELKAVAAFVATMPRKVQAPTLEGADAAAGATSYATCLACHGPDGKGNEALHAPPIAGQYDWYLVSQLTKFRKGIRGANPKDVTGGQMRPMSMTLADDQAVKNVVAHISTLAKQQQ